MQAAAGSDTPDVPNHSYRAVVLELVALTERIQASMKVLERAIAEELPSGNPDVHDNVFILDDVTPCYAKASAALRACHAGLSEALHSVHRTPASNPGADRRARSHGRPGGA